MTCGRERDSGGSENSNKNLKQITVERYKNILCIAGSELIRSEGNPTGVMSMPYYTKLVAKKTLNRIRRANKETPALIEYDSLPLKYRRAWESLHGDPHSGDNFEPFAKRLRPDWDARNAYTDYRYNDGQSLKADVIEAYCNDAMILNAVKETIAVKSEARGSCRKSMRGNWDDMLELVDKVRQYYKNNLPKTAITLKRKYDRYVAEGYYSLIHSGYGNKNATLIKTDLCESVLIDLMGHGNQLPAPLVAQSYNLWAEPNGYKAITERTVVNYMERHDFEIGAARRGAKNWADKYDPVIIRSRPSAPLLLVNSDDNDLDLYFKNGKDNYYRYKMYVVLDAHCDYILGYAIGDQITKELVKQAHRDALRHIKELTGAYYLWDQAIADHWGLKGDLLDFFKSLSQFTPPTVGLARAKVIEQSFGTSWHNTLKQYSNYAGHNITAQEKHNPDFAQSKLRDRPNAVHAKVQIAQFVEMMRNIEWNKSGKSRREVWVENFKASQISQANRISDEVYLQKLGIAHNYENTVRNTGINITVNEIKYNYDVPVEIYRQAVGSKVRVKYDPADMSQVLVEGDKIRFIARENEPMPMALADYKAGDRTKLNTRLDTKAQIKQAIKEEKENRKAILERAGIDANSLLQAGVLVKAERFKATETATRMAMGIEPREPQNISELM